MTSTRNHPLDFYGETLAERKLSGLERRCRAINDKEFPRSVIDGQPVLNFSSNDYLGLAQDSRIREAATSALEQYGLGTGGSRLINGTRDLHAQLEEGVARWKGTEAALVFNSGYQANVGILQALLAPGDWVFCDRLNHASLMDGCLLSGARWSRYRHLNLSHLEDKLKKAPIEAKKWVVTDTLFSMDGDWPDLQALATLAEKYNALVMVDEAHASGVFGEKRSSGLVEHLGVDGITLHMGTFSKALGGFGGYVAGPRVLIDYLIHTARSFIYSTSLPPTIIAGNLKAVEIVQTDTSLKQSLWNNMAFLKPRLESLLKTQSIEGGSPSQIIPIILGDSRKATALSETLLNQGVFLQAVRPPTVPEDSARLRLSLSARHTPAHLETLLKTLENAL